MQDTSRCRAFILLKYGIEVAEPRSKKIIESRHGHRGYISVDPVNEAKRGAAAQRRSAQLSHPVRYQREGSGA